MPAYRLPSRPVSTLLAAIVLAASAALPAAAQEDEVRIEKATDGQDADAPPGPVLIVGDPVTWSYRVFNTGSRPITGITVSDDQEGAVTCPATTLDAGESMTCTPIVGTAQPGQYVNVATVDALNQASTPISDTDPSHYFGQAAPAIDLEKETEGFDADSAPGPILAVGDPVSWTYEVTNVGSDPLTDVAVTDDQGVAVSCPGTTLAPGESMTCTAAGTVQVGQYSNLGTATAELPSTDLVADSDPSHYFGQTLLLEKATNGDDADGPPGPTLEAGDPVTWTYEVTNPGPATVTGLSVSDDQEGAVTCPQTTLAPGESVTCTHVGTAQGGSYVNVGTATATLPLGGVVTASDPSHYTGTLIRIEKATNGQDADLPPGPVLAVGDPVSWTYEVTNFGDDGLTDVAVVDDQGVTVTCPGTTLAPGESMTCTAAGVAAAGQYANVGTVTATHPTAGVVADSDPSHYLGQDQVLDLGDAPAPYPTAFAANGARHLLGSGVFLGACVDSELDGQPSAGADGDDLGAGLATFGTCAVAGDDEDGVVVDSPLVVGATADLTVTASAACTLSAWIDWNADGDWSDGGEELFPGGTALAAGTNARSVAVPSGAALGATTSRFRCTTDGAVTPVGEASDGEVEDHAVAVEAPRDFGDAADPPYPTLLASDGARHVLGSAVFLGACVDSETDGQPTAGATGDDAAAGALTFGACAVAGDDGDGVAFGALTVGEAASVDVTANAACTLSAWVDFGGDGDWSDPGDELFPGGQALAAGTTTLGFTVPATAVAGATVSRFRCTTGGAVGVTGEAADGEVEDHAVTIDPGAPDVSATKTVSLLVDQDGDGAADAGDTLAYEVVIRNDGLGPADGLVFTDTPDPNTALVPGSVTATQGTVVSGNAPGDPNVEVDLGSLAPGATATIGYQVTIHDPLPPGVHEIVNQGSVAGDAFPPVPTDDPGEPGGDDPTVVVLGLVTPLEIPTLGAAGLAALVLLLAGLALGRLPRRSAAPGPRA